ncbi:hypothetical protein [Capnocytophaga canis]|uniref:Uncharacterized protein n=1 Tax=Capnocytophaga canis TaxID=1848903 RepID=A0A0B7IJ69_9FLAO|nr:hypothetical protein [Capnocytophaga canis]CEN51945.1 hypothetical protein CCAND93_20051 [Capnocytophaga canis]
MKKDNNHNKILHTTPCGAVIDINNPTLDLKELEGNDPRCELCSFSQTHSKNVSNLTFCTLKMIGIEKKNVCNMFEYRDFGLYLVYEKKKYLDRLNKKPEEPKKSYTQLSLF